MLTLKVYDIPEKRITYIMQYKKNKIINMKTILVPTDFSKNAGNAVQYAIKIAKKQKAKIILLHVFHFPYVTPDTPVQFISETIEEIQKTSEKKLKLLSSDIIKSKIKCEYLNHEGLPAGVILETIEKKKPDLVIMGTKGASGIKELIMGSNTAKVIEKSTHPVIAIPAGAKFNGIKKIIYASDYHTSDIDALKKLVELAKFFNAKIVVLHVTDGAFNQYSEETYLNDFKNKVRKKIKYEKITYKLASGKYLPSVLEKNIKEELPDLIAMSNRHRNLFERIFGSSVTKKMAYHSKIPLMAFHHKQESVVFI